MLPPLCVGMLREMSPFDSFPKLSGLTLVCLVAHTESNKERRREKRKESQNVKKTLESNKEAQAEKIPEGE